ncbi:unnamed protein product, partial [Rotaria magnacalcarata]
FINIVPVTMQSISIQIEDLEQLLMKFADRLFGIVDPTINKFRNVTFEIISELENRIEVNTSEVFYRLETNLFVLLFTTIVFFIFVLILLTLLENLLMRYKILPENRRTIGLAIITIVFVWLFIALILSTWLPTTKLNLKILQYIFMGLISSILIYLIFVWISYFYTHRTRTHNNFTQCRSHEKNSRILTKRRSACVQEGIELTHG